MATHKPAFTTNYRDEWIKYRKSEKYKAHWDILRKFGHKQRYINNLLREVFDAGWGSREIFETTKPQ
jgi:hypothetical protein